MEYSVGGEGALVVNAGKEDDHGRRGSEGKGGLGNLKKLVRGVRSREICRIPSLDVAQK